MCWPCMQVLASIYQVKLSITGSFSCLSASQSILLKNLKLKSCFITFAAICAVLLYLFVLAFNTDMYLVVHFYVCAHVFACSGVCDWQPIGWLEWAPSPAVCSHLLMLGASGEMPVDLLLVASHISTYNTPPPPPPPSFSLSWSCSTVTTTHYLVCWDATEDAVLIGLYVWVQYKTNVTDFRANMHRHSRDSQSDVCACICMHSTTAKCRSHKKEDVGEGKKVSCGSWGRRKPFIMSLRWSNGWIRTGYMSRFTSWGFKLLPWM